jgi:hypothetical protein
MVIFLIDRQVLGPNAEDDKALLSSTMYIHILPNARDLFLKIIKFNRAP